MGWDISSTTCGWSVLEIDKNNIKYIDSGHIKPMKKGDIFERLKDTQNKVKELLNKYKPDEIAIENITEFMANKSSSKTIIMLALFNRMIGIVCYDYLGKSPELISVMSIRHGLKLTKELPKKEEMPALVEKHLNITLPVKLKKNGKIADEYYDQADAVAVGTYFSLKLTNKLDEIKNARK
jgi:Holliday junction resolvasome RuvABC endonuclease subunit